jgi:adrenodoxin-NADP+ reductase
VPKICIIGSGPSAMYVTQYADKMLTNKGMKPIIDIYEKMPVPFGLVRYGVAPDHQDVKNVIKAFTKTLSQDNINFFGNIQIGKDIKLSDLLKNYNAIVLSYGSQTENELPASVVNGRNYDLANYISAKDLVSWYNGMPTTKAIKDIKKWIDLSGSKCVIIGAGNVSIDIARLLLCPISKIDKTDISGEAMELLQKLNKINEVTFFFDKPKFELNFEN